MKCIDQKRNEIISLTSCPLPPRCSPTSANTLLFNSVRAYLSPRCRLPREVLAGETMLINPALCPGKETPGPDSSLSIFLTFIFFFFPLLLFARQVLILFFFLLLFQIVFSFLPPPPSPLSRLAFPPFWTIDCNLCSFERLPFLSLPFPAPPPPPPSLLIIAFACSPSYAITSFPFLFFSRLYHATYHLSIHFAALVFLTLSHLFVSALLSCPFSLVPFSAASNTSSLFFISSSSFYRHAHYHHHKDWRKYVNGEREREREQGEM